MLSNAEESSLSKNLVRRVLKFLSTFPLLAPSLTGVWIRTTPSCPHMRDSWTFL